MFKSIVIVAICLAVCHAAKLPSYFTKCKRSDSNLNSCIFDNIKNGYDKFKIGDNAHHIQTLSPLKVPRLFIDVNGGLIINLTDVTISGLGDAVFKKVQFDVDKKEVKLDFMLPTELNCIAQYDINGRILILPIQGHGPMNVTFAEPVVTYTFTYDIEKQGSNEYLIPKTNTFQYIVTRIYFGLENLFNGDKRLGEEMSKFLNENWKEVDEEIGTKLGEAFGEVLMQCLKAFFKKVPLTELMDD